MKLIDLFINAFKWNFSSGVKHQPGKHAKVWTPKKNPAGAKIAKKAAKSSIGLRNGPGGIVSAAVREMAADKYLAKQANKEKS